jgi:hypothetical protein
MMTRNVGEMRLTGVVKSFDTVWNYGLLES